MAAGFDELPERGDRPRWRRIGGFAAVYAISLWLAIILQLGDPRVAVVHAGSSVLLAALLTFPRRDWLWLIAAAIVLRAIVATLEGRYILLALFSIPFMVPATTLAALALLRARATPPFGTLRAMGVFLIISIAVLPLAITSVTLIIPSPDLSFGDARVLFRTSYLSIALRTTLLTPLFAVGLRYTQQLPYRPWRSGSEGAALLAGLAIAVYGVLGTGIPTNPTIALMYVPLPFLVWAGVRLGVTGTAASLLLLAGVAGLRTLEGRGPFLNGTLDEQILSMQVFVLMLSVPFLLLAALMTERSATQAALADSERDVQQRLAELSSLYRHVPIGLAFIDRSLKVVKANDQFADLSLTPADALAGRPLADVVPRLSEALEPLCRDAAQHGAPFVDVEIEVRAPGTSEPQQVWLASGHPLIDDDAKVQGVSLVLQDVAAKKRVEQSIRNMAIGVAPNGGTGFFSALAEHIALALQTDFVLIAQLVPPSREHVRVIAAVVDGRPAPAADSSLSGTIWEHAREAGLWRNSDASASYDSVYPRLEGVSIRGCLVMSLADSEGTAIGFIAALNRRPFRDADAAAATLKVFAARAAAEMDRKRSEDENVQLVSELGTSVRELTLLHHVTRVLQRDDLAGMAAWMQEVVAVVLSSWPLPGALAVRARLGSSEVATPYRTGLHWKYRADFVAADGQSGAIEIGAAEGNGAPSRLGLLDSTADMLRTAIDRRLAIAALQQSEQRYRSVVEHQSDLVCRFLADTTLTFVNEAYCRFFGKPREQLIGFRFTDLIPEIERPEALRHVQALLEGDQPRVYEHNVLLPDGGLGRQQWIDYPIISPSGEVEEIQGIGRDITDRWRAEEALRMKEASLRDAYERIRSLAHKLILAQEAERTEIARDLHDDVSQQLAALTIGLSVIEQRVANREDLRHEVADLRLVAGGLAEKVRHASHTLHPGVLRHAGLSAALASHCESVSAQHPLVVSFHTEGRVDDVAGDTALCVYRVVQQALRNVVLHADARAASVTLLRRSRRLELTIADDGRGFDTSKAHMRGIGLTSISERVHLANGTFSIDSTPGGGSRLWVDLPV